MLKKLKEPFHADEIEWRVQSSGMKGDKPWAMVLAYVQARAIQNRLDCVFGPLGWQDTYIHLPNGVMCRLSAKHEGEWIYKENGSPETAIEGFKGGISKAFVRVAASGYGIGRYLYSLSTTFVNHDPNGSRYDAIKDRSGKKIGSIKWNPPKLPDWALPDIMTGTQRNTLIELAKKLNLSFKDFATQYNISKETTREEADEAIKNINEILPEIPKYVQAEIDSMCDENEPAYIQAIQQYGKEIETDEDVEKVVIIFQKIIGQ